jgi:hypothetical protein
VVGTPATLTEQATIRFDPGFDLNIPVRADVPLSVFAGQPDPTDPSRFTIDYLSGTVRKRIDGVLKDDDTVELKVRIATSYPTSNP